MSKISSSSNVCQAGSRGVVSPIQENSIMSRKGAKVDKDKKVVADIRDNTRGEFKTLSI